MWLTDLAARLVARLSPDATDVELDEEIRHHIDLETARQVREGLDPATARRRALEKFGDPRRIAQATRDERRTSISQGTLQDFRWAVRILRRQAAFTTLALVTLAIGIGTTTVAFATLDTALLRPLPFAEPDRLVVIREVTAERNVVPPSYPNFADWRSRARSFSAVVSELLPSARTVFVGDEPLRVTSMGVSRGFFEVLGVKPVLGREFTAQENSRGGPPLVMVSHRFWVERLGSRPALGTLRLGDRSAEIIGVLPPGLLLIPQGDPADIYVPNEQTPNSGRANSNYVVIGRLAPKATIESARAEMATLSRALLAAYGTDTRAVDVQIMSLREEMVNDHRSMLVIVFGAAALVLLIACTNLVSAQLARGLGRSREIGVRAALGASRGRLVRQLLAESAALSVAGALLGLGVTVVLTRMVRVLGAPLVPRLQSLSVDGRALAFAAGATVLTLVLIGVYPALRLATSDPGDIIRGASKNPNAGTRSAAWPLLVGFEIAVAVVLVVGSTLLVRTMRNIMASDAGLDPRGLVTAAMSSSDGLDRSEIERIVREIEAIPGVAGAAMVSRYPLVWWAQSGPVVRPSDPPAQWPAMAGFRVVSPEYFAVARQRLLQGRTFTRADDTTSARVAIITPGIAAALWPGQDPIGKTIRTNYLSDQWLTVAGVVAEASSWAMPRGSQNEIFVPLAQQPQRARNQLVIVARTDGNPRALVPVLRDRLRAVAPRVPATLEAMTDRIAHSAADRRFAMIALGVFASIALILAGLGIYGVVSYSVGARTHEIGVRVALGATPLAVQLDVLRGAAGMAVGGVLVGLVGSFFATAYVKSLLYEVARFDATAYWGAAVFLVITALVGAYLPARRSSRVDPLIALRGEG
jgi:putative ABC transport system permease protein